MTIALSTSCTEVQQLLVEPGCEPLPAREPLPRSGILTRQGKSPVLFVLGGPEGPVEAGFPACTGAPVETEAVKPDGFWMMNAKSLRKASHP
jgi:hypothetical protein